jgi:hypothetical protein
MPNVDLVHASPTGASAWEAPPAEEDPMTADAHPRDHDRSPVTDGRWIALTVIAAAPAHDRPRRHGREHRTALRAAVVLIIVRAARPAAHPHL